MAEDKIGKVVVRWLTAQVAEGAKRTREQNLNAKTQRGKDATRLSGRVSDAPQDASGMAGEYTATARTIFVMAPCNVQLEYSTVEYPVNWHDFLRKIAGEMSQIQDIHNS